MKRYIYQMKRGMYMAFRKDMNHKELIDHINTGFGLCVTIQDIIIVD